MASQAPACPRCFERSTDTAYTCRTPGCGKSGAVQTALEVSTGENSAPHCSSCGQPLERKACPHCGHTLPEDGSAPALPLLLAGATGSGKSVYLSLLLAQIRQEMGKAFDCALCALGTDNETKLIDALYHRPVFTEGRCPPATEPEDLIPLEYSVLFSGGKQAGNVCNLRFYDSCGVSFGDEKSLAAGNRSLPHAKGILFFVEPTQLPGVRDSVRGERPEKAANQAALLTRMIHVIRETVGPGDLRQKIKIPIAVCLSKLDTVRHLLDPSSFVGAPSRNLRTPQLDAIDTMSCDYEVQSLIESWSDRELISQVHAQFADSCFFGLSALGAQPENGRILHHIAPHRVIDPFLWLLWKNHIITKG